MTNWSETKLFDISFRGMDELLKLAAEQMELLQENVRAAVADSTLLAARAIGNDTPVDTGRLWASIFGDMAEAAGVSLIGSAEEAAGRALSTTGISDDGMEGRVGTNVEYATYVEYGFCVGPASGRRKKLTAKQLRYLFAAGILVKGPNGEVTMPNAKKPDRKERVNAGINVRAGWDMRRKVKGKGFFRRNLPVIQHHLQAKMEEAIRATADRRSLGPTNG